MFATNSTASASGSQAPSWMSLDHPHHHDMLLSTSSDVLDYTSFSDDSHSPVLSLQSFESQQHSPDLDSYCFQDFEPMVDTSCATSSSPLTQSAVNSETNSLSNQGKPSATETERQAALLHAYLAAQSEAYNNQLRLQQQQQQEQMHWNLAVLAQAERQKMQQQEQQDAANKSQQAAVVQQKALDNTQKSDAENLARYLAQMREIKEEKDSMDHADASFESAHAPSSPSSTSSSIMAERSPSPEVTSNEGSPAKNSGNAKSSSRQLVCFNCHVTQTPLWRRTPDRQHSLCNACGLYYKQYGAHRPLNVRHKLPSVLVDARAQTMPYGRSSTRGSSPSGPESSASSDSDSDSGAKEPRSLPDLTKMYADALIRPTALKTNPPLMTAKQGIECANCSQTQTPLWRKNEAGEPICNACGLYAKLHNRARPVTMRKSKITRRRRDWGGNLAQQAQAQAQALALFHAQVQAQVEAQAKGGEAASVEVSMVQEMSRRAQELNGHSSVQSPVDSSDSEDDQSEGMSSTPKTSQLQSSESNAVNSCSSSGGNVAQKLSGNLILDEHKFSDMVGQMSAHQMNRFLSILESRCGVLRNRILASTEGSAQDSSLDNLF
ncbi:hypothetical protein EDD11_006340 [Mortierella claussenii]|nr:hypothetical protein EDD11_006340 [Mortierella claussenii]